MPRRFGYTFVERERERVCSYNMAAVSTTIPNQNNGAHGALHYLHVRKKKKKKKKKFSALPLLVVKE